MAKVERCATALCSIGLIPDNRAPAALVGGFLDYSRPQVREQPGHMTASDKRTNQIKNVLLCRCHPHTIFAASAELGLGELLQF